MAASPTPTSGPEGLAFRSPTFDPNGPGPVHAPPITSVSVKVMRSHDYCHFEVVLGSDVESVSALHRPEEVDALRKVAARLVDKAVAQYIVAKREREQRARLEPPEWLHERMAAMAQLPETERTPEQQAELKEYQDRLHEARCVRAYDYEDDWDEEDDQD